MDNIFGIDQNVLEVQANLEKAIFKMRMAGYNVPKNCRFEEYKNKCFVDYLN